MANKGKAPTRKKRKPIPKGPKPVDWRPAYFAALQVRAGNRSKAANDVPVDYATVWKERQKDPEFAKLEAQIVDQGTDMLEDEAIRRAYEGCPHYTLDRKTGKTVITRIEYSDTLLLRVLETRRPHWRPKSAVDVTSGGKSFDTRADRKRALSEARSNSIKPLD